MNQSGISRSPRTGTRVSLRTLIYACMACCLAPPLSATEAQIPIESLGPTSGGGIASGGDGCGELLMNADGTYEMPYCWQYGGVVPPDYGAFAECYFGVFEVCSVVADLVTTDGQDGQTMDVYVWDDDGGEPGNVLCLVPEVDPGPIAFWPSLSRHEIEIPEGCCTGDTWWVGYWPDWPGEYCAWFLGGDSDGQGGCPRTNIAPGIGFPTGWQNVSVAWGPTQAMGLGARVRECGTTPTSDTTWGNVKSLFR